jgi:hypothetical protein
MSTNAKPTNAFILAGRATLPEHVVYRAFVKETVVLNLDTGKYHGLNPTAGRMFEALERAPTVGDAGRLLAERFGRPLDEIELDLCGLCRDLLERGLIEMAAPEQS